AHGVLERHWSEEWASFVVGRLALEHGDVGIDEYPDVDLAVVRPAGAAGAATGRQPSAAGASVSRQGAAGASVSRQGAAGASVSRQAGAAGALPVHPAAVHSATSASRILAFNGDGC